MILGLDGTLIYTDTVTTGTVTGTHTSKDESLHCDTAGWFS